MRRAIRAGAFGAAVVLGAGALSACSDDESAEVRVCDARSDLRAAVDDLVAALSDRDLEAAGSAVDDARAAFKDLTDAGESLSAERQDAISTALSDAGTALVAIPEADSLEDAEARIAEARTAIGTALDTIGDRLEC